MRPDEHKKKKNAEYKKKHDIHINKKTKKDGGKKEKVLESGAREEKKANNTETTNYHDQAEITQANDTQKFSRRKIQSNWTRYDNADVSDDDKVYKSHSIQRRGADFSTLIQEAGDSHSQFRFKDEKDWEDNSQTVASHHSLEINFQELSESLKSLPMYERLDIVDIKMNEGNNKTHHEHDETAGLEQPGSQEITSIPIKNNVKKAVEDMNFLPFDAKIKNNMQHSSRLSSKTKAFDKSTTDKEVDKLLDQELDMLLSLDKHQAYKQTVQQAQPMEKHSMKEHLREKSTAGAYYGLDQKPLGQSGKIAQPATKVNSKEELGTSLTNAKSKAIVPDMKDSKQDEPGLQKEENLEDWLDSVLGS